MFGQGQDAIRNSPISSQFLIYKYFLFYQFPNCIQVKKCYTAL